ncbi:MAG: FAD-dependent oxidoreductase [Candidatus Gastranaerophilales bacterium]
MQYDVIVVGGGTAGCAAAYIAGKNGLKTLLVEKNIHLGGAITSGLVLPAMKCGENQINTSFFDDLVQELKSLGGQVSFQGNDGWFHPELTKIALDNLMEQANVEVRFSSQIDKIDKINNEITKLFVHSHHERLSSSIEAIQSEGNCRTPDIKILFEPIEARYVIDATGNCEIGKIAGCNFLEKKVQPNSLRFIMSGVDINAFGGWLEAIDNNREVSPIEVIDGVMHLSTAYTWDKDKNWAIAPYFNEAVKNGDLNEEDCNYFQIFTVAKMPTSIAFNCPRLLVDEYDLSSKNYSISLKKARLSILRLSNFCKKYLKGFENSYISNIADELGVRVSERILGKYIYTIDDIKSFKKFDNPVVISNYPIDVHSKNRNSSVLTEVSEYMLPIESLMSADIKNLFIAGKCLSADFMAQGALRVQPSCFSMGEGIAKYIANNLLNK